MGLAGIAAVFWAMISKYILRRSYVSSLWRVQRNGKIEKYLHFAARDLRIPPTPLLEEEWNSKLSALLLNREDHSCFIGLAQGPFSPPTIT